MSMKELWFRMLPDEVIDALSAVDDPYRFNMILGQAGDVPEMKLEGEGAFEIFEFVDDLFRMDVSRTMPFTLVPSKSVRIWVEENLNRDAHEYDDLTGRFLKFLKEGVVNQMGLFMDGSDMV
jgi:hypothetical protein